MATTKEFHDYIMECLSFVGECESRKMMGEYCIYYRGKVIALLCDNLFMLKPTETVLAMLPDAERAYPYEGSKTLMVIADDPENRELMGKVIERMYYELPEPKPKKNERK